MKTHIKQQGSVVHITIVIVLVVAVLGLLGYVLWQRLGQQATNTANTTQQVQKTNADLPQTYVSSVGQFTIDYPSDWVLNTNVDTSNPDFPTDSSTLTSPSGTVLKVGAFDDARGGDCPTNSNQTPFAAGNDCPSLEYLSAEKLSISNAYGLTAKVADQTAQENVYLVTSKYGDVDGSLTYTIGAVSANVGPSGTNTVPLDQPYMGFITSDMEISRVNQDFKNNQTQYPAIAIYAQGKSSDFLTSKDADTIKEIIRSLQLN